ncbi:hypothetical protein BKA69DRAFT_1122376 [Paraphysoderma sedebokerense]|nr:hypothetical protein BKA69DRAFT_1122376 [Paraphysoderma sedebokerense]
MNDDPTHSPSQTRNDTLTESHAEAAEPKCSIIYSTQDQLSRSSEQSTKFTLSDSYRLFETLNRRTTPSHKAYDTSIEGWSSSVNYDDLWSCDLESWIEYAPADGQIVSGERQAPKKKDKLHDKRKKKTKRSKVKMNDCTDAAKKSNSTVGEDASVQKFSTRASEIKSEEVRRESTADETSIPVFTPRMAEENNSDSEYDLLISPALSSSTAALTSSRLNLYQTQGSSVKSYDSFPQSKQIKLPKIPRHPSPTISSNDTPHLFIQSCSFSYWRTSTPLCDSKSQSMPRLESGLGLSSSKAIPSLISSPRAMPSFGNIGSSSMVSSTTQKYRPIIRKGNMKSHKSLRSNTST